MSKSTFIERLQKAIGDNEIPEWLAIFVATETTRFANRKQRQVAPSPTKESVEAIIVKPLEAL
jgi:hypothetical protein